MNGGAGGAGEDDGTPNGCNNNSWRQVLDRADHRFPMAGATDLIPFPPECSDCDLDRAWYIEFTRYVKVYD